MHAFIFSFAQRLTSLSLDPGLWYVAAVPAVSLILAWWLWCQIRAVELGRRRHIRTIKKFESVTTETPLDDPVARARARSLENVKSRFTIIRRLVVPAVALTVALALSIPLMRNMPATFVSFVIGVATVVVGIAAKPFIECVIAGLVISFAQPIRVGDTVKIDNQYGTVENISLTYTVIKLWDWRRFVVPNHRMLQKELVNYSLVDRFLWSYVEFWVSYDADLAEVKEVAIDAARKAENFASHEEPAFWIMDLGDRGVQCWVAAWANTPSQAWDLKHEIRGSLVRSFQARGIRCHTYHHQLDQPLAEAPHTPRPDRSAG